MRLTVVFLALGAAFGLAVSGCRHLPPASPAPAETPPKPSAPAGITNAPPSPTTTNAAAEKTAIQAPAVEESDDEAYRQVRILTKAIMVIRHDYVDESKVAYSNLISSALSGMMQALDPYSQYMEPPDYQDLKDDTQGKFGGIGIQVAIKDNLLTVIAPMEDTPAYRAGIVSGDKIIEINGEKTDKLTMPDAVHKLRGKEGTNVKLKILREKDTKEFTLTRAIIKITSVKGVRLLPGDIGYLRITEFSDPTSDGVRDAMAKLLGQHMKALVLDLRNNPGGLLSSAVQVSELFLKKGALIVTTRGRGDRPRQMPAFASGTIHHTDFPMVVLINSGSASAAEIVAGALHDNKRAILVGDVTFGKGSVQNILPIEDGAALRLTTARYYTPSGQCIHEVGIEPDILVPIPLEEWANVLRKRSFEETPALVSDQEKPANFDKIVDRQLERAVDMLKALLIFQAPK
jgi:carboxyl-terminal processing protease